ncbi:hypothetical protein RND71_012393 [Anisodus tanguticus]|uniref:Uncharacterized protein n=1 Tax=Anisodus tanguticus TaxID=243964 RepID=A0AAE1SGX6_9SOLA|nr:hypothetical protein RND71_012393 [Anisodus tanguticus]
MNVHLEGAALLLISISGSSSRYDKILDRERLSQKSALSGANPDIVELQCGYQISGGKKEDSVVQWEIIMNIEQQITPKLCHQDIVNTLLTQKIKAKWTLFFIWRESLIKDDKDHLFRHNSR